MFMLTWSKEKHCHGMLTLLKGSKLSKNGDANDEWKDAEGSCQLLKHANIIQRQANVDYADVIKKTASRCYANTAERKARFLGTVMLTIF